MQKKIIALAIAGLASTAAFAQTNVTIYGVVDVQQAFVKSSGDAAGNNQGTVGRLDAHGNYVGFKGVEDLGNGLKALFQYETEFYADNGGGMTGNRDTFVGLTGGFGTVVAGRLTHPLRAMGAKVELLPGAAGFGTMASVTGTIANIKTGADDRANNAVAYVSPSFSGFTGTVAYINGENKTNSVGAVEAVNQRQWQVAANYENGPLFVGAGYHKAYDFSATAATTVPANQGAAGLAVSNGQDARVFRLAAAYTLPTNTKLTALYDNTKVENVAAFAGSPDVKRQAFSLGVAQEFGKNVVGLEYGRSGKIKADGDKVDGTSSNIWTAMYGYNLSKRTMLHARISRLNNGENADTRFYNLPVANGVATSDAADYTGYSVGLRHTF